MLRNFNFTYACQASSFNKKKYLKLADPLNSAEEMGHRVVGGVAVGGGGVIGQSTE